MLGMQFNSQMQNVFYATRGFWNSLLQSSRQMRSYWADFAGHEAFIDTPDSMPNR